MPLTGVETCFWDDQKCSELLVDSNDACEVSTVCKGGGGTCTG